MKKIVMIGFILMCLCSNAFAAEGSYGEKVRHKAYRGVKNVLCSEIVIPKYIQLETEKHGKALGRFLGFVRGANMVGLRKIVGIADLLTAPFPFDIYVFDPEVPGGMTDAEKKQ